MSKCDDLFEQRQSLIRKKAEIDEQIAKMKTIQMSNQIPGDDTFLDAMTRTAKYLEELEAQKSIKKAIEAEKKPGVSIPKNQPTNFVKELRDRPDEVVANWANYSQALLRAGKETLDGRFAFLDVDPLKSAQMLSDAYDGKLNVNEALDAINKLTEGEKTFVEDLVRARWFHDTGKEAYIKSVDDIDIFMEKNPNAEVPPELLGKAFNTYKVALMSEATYDFYRNQWSKAGKAQQGRLFTDQLEVVDDASSVIPDDIKSAESYVDSLGILGKKIGDTTEEESIARVITAASENITRPKEAMDQLNLELNNIRIQGTDVRKRYDPKRLKDARFRHTNLLAKDSQLFNLRTMGLAFSSNVAMAIRGPYHTLYKNALYKPYGTKLSGSFMDAWQANWKGYAAAYKAVRESGKELFMDAWKGDRMFYSSNVETYGKFYEPIEKRLADLEDAKNVKGNWLSYINPEKYRRELHANARLWLYRKTKHPAALRPGFSALAALDAPFGYGYHVYKLRTDLEFKARRDGVQLGLFDEESINKWINDQFAEQFYKLEPSEAQIKAYRQEQNIPSGIMDDRAVADEIIKTRVANTYGGPVNLDDLSRGASEFSQDMRFQSPPGEGNFLGKKFYEIVNGARQTSPLFDITVAPYLVAPMKGISLDMKGLGFSSINDWIGHVTGNRRLNPEQIASAKADAILAMHIWSIALIAKANDQIIGNGPTNPQERAAWLTELRAQGKKPNSMFGVPLIGGLPMINTMFLISDIIDGGQKAVRSDYDKKTIAGAILDTLVGNLRRNTSLGTVTQILDLAYGDQYGRRRPMDFLGYLGGSQAVGIGIIRSGERATNSKKSNLYRDAEPTKKDEELYDIGVLQNAERILKNAATGVTGLTGVAGGAYKDKDWLGSDIKLPFGMELVHYLEHRFFPHLHPNDKVYAELQMLELLDPPNPLLRKRLMDVPMSDDLQKEFNDTYGSIAPGVGDVPNLGPVARAELGGSNKSIRVSLPVFVNLKDLGIRLKEQKELVDIKINPLIEKHVFDEKGKGRTFIDAARSLINDPIYDNMQSDPTTSADLNVSDKTNQDRKRMPAYLMMSQLKKYYELITTDAIGRSDSPAAIEWQERNDIKEIELRDQALQEAKSTVNNLSRQNPVINLE